MSYDSERYNFPKNTKKSKFFNVAMRSHFAGVPIDKETDHF